MLQYLPYCVWCDLDKSEGTKSQVTMTGQHNKKDEEPARRRSDERTCWDQDDRHEYDFMMAIQQALLIRKRENRRIKGRRERPGLFTFVFVLAALINLLRFLYFHNPKPTALQKQDPRFRGDGFYAFYKSKSYNITLESLSDLLDSELVQSVINRTKITLEEASRGKEPLMEMLEKAGVVNIDVRVVQLLPTWDQVEELYGEAPIVEGMSQCHDFRRYHPFHYLGIAGMFDSGTNLASNYLEVNCVVQGRMPAWQVPWGKVSKYRLDCFGESPVPT